MSRVRRNRPIKAAIDPNWNQRAFDQFIEDWDGQAYNYGFSISGTSLNNIKVEPIARDWQTSGGVDYAPEIKILSTPGDDDGDYWFIPIVTFPVIDGNDMQFADDFEAICDAYKENLGPFCTNILKSIYNSDMYEFDDEDDY